MLALMLTRTDLSVIAIVGGLIVSQMPTFYTTPVIYLVFDQLRQRRKLRRSVEKLAEAGWRSPQPSAG